ncbi:n-Acetylglucosaminyltransferase-IV (GnT-IV) domain-containing protein [Hirsutella rhossiliensis]|uniref:N-Acetylglucosaminyltransferase-IV (GnT-IV) domain-containing protein n=1 Tax=Hirsutella rhossiliensis TaxID=111463 RepID=A0A9P8MN16_9HYPO|nr:n-Acetylglucosaminyltransferase-IV (GnT-IV) domain-containing protein [Hirsutella rhossiliensis]KAH0958080.1 n-Acetylglucosaminyltransferase-IV (GnT-IV) domain-containing protein [Hirsutella rhossiliensis]
MRLNAGFWLLWLSLLTFCYFNSYDDPSSIFYDQSRAYEQKYSLQRAAEAKAYLQHLPPKIDQAEPHGRLLCIGIPSINRTSESFLAFTVATLVDTLTPEDRASIHLVVLLADRAPENHFAYSQPWLANIADEVLLYGDGPSSTNESVYRTVPYNHSVLVETCRHYGSPYFALVEDDIIASPRWFAQLKKSLQYVETQSKKTSKDWVYLRLFYSEIFMGWNNEEWLSYFQNIILAYIVVLLAFLVRILLRRRLKYVPVMGSARSCALLMALVLGLWLPALIALYFIAGRISGLVFPQQHLEGFQALLRNPPYAFAGDQILEDYARDHSLAKWALEPSVFQHVGLKQSSAGDQRAEVWNFSFERQHGKGEA